jgi:hypothetical protein
VPLSSKSLKRPIPPQKAVAAFLKSMAKISRRTFPQWNKTLIAGVEECALSYDQRRALLDIHPFDDYYFAGLVALESVNIRAQFSSDEAAELLSQLAEQVDAAVHRTDRLVSDLVFVIINQIEVMAGIDKQKKPYDQAVKVILRRIGVDKIESTRHLMTEFIYRHTLGEPMALEVPQWWRTFNEKYLLSGPIERAPAEIRVEPHAAAAPSPVKRTARSLFQSSLA